MCVYWLWSVHGSMTEWLEVRYITNRIWNCRQIPCAHKDWSINLNFLGGYQDHLRTALRSTKPKSKEGQYIWPHPYSCLIDGGSFCQCYIWPMQNFPARTLGKGSKTPVRYQPCGIISTNIWITQHYIDQYTNRMGTHLGTVLFKQNAFLEC